MTKPMEPYVTREAILAANGLVAAHLEWAKARAAATDKTEDKVEKERRTRYVQMATEAVEDHDLGALMMGLTHVASAAVKALAAYTPGGEEAVLKEVAATTLREEES